MVPVITAASSILGFRRNEAFQFQPAATNSPTSWAATGLPAGVTINATTGLISGSIAAQGVWVISVTATNGSGPSAAVQFVLATSPEIATAAATGDVATEWEMDVVTRQLSPLGAQATDVLGSWKKDDVFLLRLRFKKGQQYVDPNPTSITLTFKDEEGNPGAAAATTFVKTGTAEAAYFDLLVDLSGAGIGNAIAAADTGDTQRTAFTALVELQIASSITFNGGSQTIRLSSRTGRVDIVRDFVA